MGAKPSPTISAAIELDNAAFENHSVWSEKIRRLYDWMHESLPGDTIEIFLVHGEAHANDIAAFLSIPWADDRARLKALPVANAQAHYYAMKNLAAQQARGKLVAFFDSDLSPCQGTFEELVRPLRDPSEVISSGYACFPVDTFLAKVYSLNWVFPVYPFSASLSKKTLLASNFVVRRDWFLKNRFQVELGGFKVACTVMSRALADQGHSINRPNVWFRHAVWNTSWRFFVWRALVMGRDADRKHASRSGERRARRIGFAAYAFLHDLKRIWIRHWRYARSTGLGLSGMVLSMCAGVFFYLLVRLAHFSSALGPVNRDLERVPRRFVT